MDIFAIATRNKYRFPHRGMLTVEDLWDLPLSQLDQVFKALNKDIKQAQEESLMTTPNDEDAELFNKIEIVRFIFDAKRAEAEVRKAAAASAEKRQRILEVLAKKQDKALEDMSEDELVQMLNNLG